MIAAILVALGVLAAAASAASAASIVFLKGGNVWLATADGAVQRQVTTGGYWDSPSQADGGAILAQRATQLFRMNRQGMAVDPPIDTTFTGAPSTWAGPVSPVISPDGINQAYGGEVSDSGYYDPGCGCWVYTHTFSTWWGSATSFLQPNQTLGQEDYVDPAWIDNSHLLLTSTGILIDQVATYALGGPDNSMVQWFSDPDSTVQSLNDPAITRSGDKLAFVANVGGLGNEIRIYRTTGPPPESPGDPANVPLDTCNIGPNNFESLRVSFSPDGQSLVYDAPDGIHLVSLVGWPNCGALTDHLIIPGGSLPYFGPADVAPSDGCGACGSGGAGTGGGVGTGGSGPGNGSTGPVALSLARDKVTRTGKIILTLSTSTAGRVFARAVTTSKRPGRRPGGVTLYGSASTSLPGAGNVVLTIKPTRAAAAGLSHRRMTVTVTVTFVPVGGSARIVQLTVTVAPTRRGRR